MLEYRFKFGLIITSNIKSANIISIDFQAISLFFKIFEKDEKNEI